MPSFVFISLFIDDASNILVKLQSLVFAPLLFQGTRIIFVPLRYPLFLGLLSANSFIFQLPDLRKSCRARSFLVLLCFERILWRFCCLNRVQTVLVCAATKGMHRYVCTLCVIRPGESVNDKTCISTNFNTF